MTRWIGSPFSRVLSPQEMKNAGFSDEEILMYSNRAYTPVTLDEKARHMEYAMKLRMTVAPMCSVNR